MILDLNNYTLSYTLNGENQGIAFKNIEQTEYRAAVTLYAANDKISLLSFETLC